MIVESLIDADRKKHWTHGLMRVLGYVDAIRDGTLNILGEVTSTRIDQNIFQFDGGGTFGQWATHLAVKEVISVMKEENLNLAQFAVTNQYHAGRLGYWVAQAVEQGFIVDAILSVGGAGRVSPLDRWATTHGTNPIAKGLPNERGPIVVDFTSAADTEGIVRLARDNGLLVSPGILQDCNGQLTRDPEVLYLDDRTKRGTLRSFGDHRGFALAMVVNLQNAILSGRAADQRLAPSANEVSMTLTRASAVSTEATWNAHVFQMANLINSVAGPLNAPEVLLPGHHGAEDAKPFLEREVVPVPEGSWSLLMALYKNPGMSVRCNT